MQNLKKNKRDATIDYKQNYTKNFEEAVKKNQEYFNMVKSNKLNSYIVVVSIYCEVGFYNRELNNWITYDEDFQDSVTVWLKIAV